MKAKLSAWKDTSQSKEWVRCDLFKSEEARILPVRLIRSGKREGEDGSSITQVRIGLSCCDIGSTCAPGRWAGHVN